MTVSFLMLGDFFQLTFSKTGAAACTSATTSVLGAAMLGAIVASECE